jgi:hypothetical protein
MTDCSPSGDLTLPDKPFGFNAWLLRRVTMEMVPLSFYIADDQTVLLAKGRILASPRSTRSSRGLTSGFQEVMGPPKLLPRSTQLRAERYRATTRNAAGDVFKYLTHQHQHPTSLRGSMRPCD